MAAYVDYTYYTTTYLGTAISSTDFPALELRAEQWINRITFQRAAPIITAAIDTVAISEIQNAVCAIAEELQKQSQANGEDALQSESQGQYSVTYRDISYNSRGRYDKINLAARDWMVVNIGLLFPGFYDGEYGNEHDNGFFDNTV